MIALKAAKILWKIIISVFEHSKFWKKFVEQDYEKQTSTRLWIVTVDKWFKKQFCGTHPF